MAAISANGQSVRLGLAYHKAQKQRMERRMQNAAKRETPQKALIAKNVRIDETTDVRGDNQYRYVFAYNKNMERSSETIYKKHFNGVEWLDEEFCNKGIYTYEYDTQGRIVSKTVKYEKQGDRDFESYNISVDYSNPEYTVYQKCTIDPDDGSYWKEAEWSFYKNGQMRHYDNIDLSSDNPYKNNCYSITYDENGSCIKLETNGQHGKELHGLLNDSTITRSEGYDGLLSPKSVESYVYNPENGKLTEYKVWGKNTDSRRYEYVYDQFGRISAIRKYYDQEDDEDVSPSPYGINKAASNREHELIEEPKWRLEYNETYKYFNDEAYGIGNPWHDVFGFDGPLTNRHLVDDDYEEGQPWVEDLTLNRDANGKLLSVVSTKPKDDEILEEYTIDVDADGHITREYTHSKEGDYAEEIITVDFMWENGKVVSAHENYQDRYQGSNTKYVRDYSYAYGDGTFSYSKQAEGNDTKTTGTIMARNKGYMIVENIKPYNDERRFIQEVQTEDVRFIRPNLIRDYEGFTTDSTIIASVKDRVVAFGKTPSYYSETDHEWGNVEFAIGDVETYFNTNEYTYFSISHDGDQTVCSNYKGQPRFILKDGRLIKEIVYEEVAYNGGTVTPAKRVAIPTGEPYKEITYLYDANGLVTGQTVKTVDENGTTTDEVKVEVKYDPTSGIDNMTVSTGGKLSLSGRTIGLTDGQTFSVFTVDGKQLSANAQSFTFPKAGVYMVSVKGKTMKLNIK